MLVSILLTILIIVFINFYFKYREICAKLHYQNDMFLYYRSKTSMIEYHYRKYKEGGNIYTTMRNIGDVLYGDFYDNE